MTHTLHWSKIRELFLESRRRYTAFEEAEVAPKGSNFQFLDPKNWGEGVADVKALKKAIWDMVRLLSQPAPTGKGGSRCLAK